MKWHMLKKQITTLLFLGVLFSFAIINGIHTVPYLLEKKEATTRELEQTINEHILGKIWFIEGYGLWNEILNKKEINNFAHIKDEKGYLHYSNFWNNEPSDVEEIMKQVLKLRAKIETQGSELIVMIPPSKEMGVTYEKGLPYSDRNWIADDYREALEHNGIKVLDLREIMRQSGLAYEEMFYVTDHHWTTEAAYQGFVAFVKQMNEWFNLNLDPEGIYTNLENYNVLEYQNSNLGSHGRQVGIHYANGLDDFTVMYPKYPTHFEYQYKTHLDSEMIEVKGRFEEVLLSTQHLSNDKIYEDDKYTTYLHGVTAMDQIKNIKNLDAPKVLFLRDSFTSPFAAFAAQVFSETDLIWTLKLQGNLEALVGDKVYDYVIISLYPDSLTSNMFYFDE